jgi:hypothetical protein
MTTTDTNTANVVRTGATWATPFEDIPLTDADLASLMADVHDDEQAMSYPNEWIAQRFAHRA